MSSNSARPNTWTVVSGDPAQLSYAPQVNPSPFTVGAGRGSLEIVITNPTNAAIDVVHVKFTIKVAPDRNKDGNALTSTTADIDALASDAKWTVEKPDRAITDGSATYTLKPRVGEFVPIPKGGSVVVQLYGFPINGTAGTSTVEITEVTQNNGRKTATQRFTVTTFPWGFVFSDLVANVPDGSGWKPVAQVENGKPVTLFWHGSVVDTGSYKIYYSNSQGQQTSTPTTLGQWTSPSLTADTVFTLGVTTNNSQGQPLTASMSVAVAVSKPDLVAKSVTAQSATLKGLTIDTQQPTWMIDNSSSGLRFGTSSNPAAAASLGPTGELSVIGVIAGKAGMGPANPRAIVAHGDVASDGRVFVGDTTNTQKDGKRVPTKGIVLDGAYVWDPYLPSPRLRFIEDIDQAKEPNTQRHWCIDALNGNMRFFVEPGYNQTGLGLGSFDKSGNFNVLGGISLGGGSTSVDAFGNITLAGTASIGGTTRIIGDLIVVGNVWKKQDGKYRFLGGYGGSWGYTCWHDGTVPPFPSDLRLKQEVQTVSSALEKVRRLCGVTFRWNEDGLQHFTRDIEKTFSAGPGATESENRKVWQTERDKGRNELAGTRVGVVAQDVEAVLPEAVITDADGYKSVRYDNLIPLLIEAIKEQDQLAARQQREIERLKLAVGMSESEVIT